MDLHHHPVLEAHRRHLGQHLGAEQLGVAPASSVPPTMRPNSASASARGRSAVARGRMAVIGGGRAGGAEVGAALAVRGEIAGPAQHVLAGQLARSGRAPREVLMLGIDHRVGAVGGDDPALPARGADRGVVAEIVVRALGGREQLDVEAVEQGARAEGVASPELRVDPVVIEVGGRRLERDVDAEHLGEDMVEPEPRRRAAEQVIMRREQPPGLARIGRWTARRDAARRARSSATPWL